MSKKNSSVSLKEIFIKQDNFIKVYSIFKKKITPYLNKELCVAVSGGPDSLALTALTRALYYEKKFKIYYVLIDHNLRAGSSKEAESVKKLLKKNKISLHVIKNKKKIENNVQSQARKVRYDLLTAFCRRKGIRTILTAHNLEDQVETFFIRLSRGSGLHGLSSMKETNKLDKRITLLRPLLEIRKNDLIKITKTAFGKFFKDPSNKNSKYLRTKIRKLRTSLENSGLDYNQIFKSICNLSKSRDTLDFHFKKIFQDLTYSKKNQITINQVKFYKLNQEMRMRVLGKCIKDISKSYYSQRSKKIINLDKSLGMKNNSQLSLGGCLIFKDKNQILIKKSQKK